MSDVLGLSQYELDRLANIARNHEVVVALGICSCALCTRPGQPTPKKARVQAPVEPRPPSTRLQSLRQTDALRLEEHARRTLLAEASWIWEWVQWLCASRPSMGCANRKQLTAIVRALAEGRPLSHGDDVLFVPAAPLKPCMATAAQAAILERPRAAKRNGKKMHQIKTAIGLVVEYCGEMSPGDAVAHSSAQALGAEVWKHEGHPWIGVNVTIFEEGRWVSSTITHWMAAGKGTSEPALWRVSMGDGRTLDLEAWEVHGGFWAGGSTTLALGTIVWARTAQYRHYWPAIICARPETTGARGILIFVSQRNRFAWADGVMLWDEGIEEGFADLSTDRVPERHKEKLQAAVLEAAEMAPEEGECTE